MSGPCWQLDATRARLADPAWNATIDLARPGSGISIGRVGPQSQSSSQILGTAFGDSQPIDAPTIDAYVRGPDLVATYDETPRHPVRAQVYWRRIEPAELSPAFAADVAVAFDLILSVNTSLLDSDPQAKVVSAVASTAAVDVRNELFCLAGLTASNLSYLQMVHPADAARTTAGPSDGRLEIAHHLFQQRLEKGVILRARVRSALIAQDRDREIASAAYDRFRLASPPLTV